MIKYCLPLIAIRLHATKHYNAKAKVSNISKICSALLKNFRLAQEKMFDEQRFVL